MKLMIDISKTRYDEIMSMDWKNRYFYDEELKAIHDGKVLEQEPCGYAVSRQAAIDAIEDDARCGVYSHFASYDDAQAFKNYIKDLPSVTAQPKMGMWIEHFDESGKWYECDQCHTDWGGSVNYCPNCGAKM